MMGLFATLSIMTLSAVVSSAHYAKCRIFVMLSVVIINVVILSVMAPNNIAHVLPFFYPNFFKRRRFLDMFQTATATASAPWTRSAGRPTGSATVQRTLTADGATSVSLVSMLKTFFPPRRQ